MDSMQASLEAESRAKAEALRIKKKLGSDINELEIALDHSNKANSEAHKSIKRYQGQLRDTEGLLEAETSQKLEITEKAGLAERKANALQGELEESRALLDSADRSKKQTDMELGEARSAWRVHLWGLRADHSPGVRAEREGWSHHHCLAGHSVQAGQSRHGQISCRSESSNIS